MMATTLLIIRHAEKPDLPGDGPGLTAGGAPSAESLVIRGWQRAGAWAALFMADSAAYPRPRVVYAADPDAAPGGTPSSRRPFQTVSPLASVLGVAVRTAWALGQEEKVAEEATVTTGVVLICWEHKRIVSDLLPAVLQKQQPPGLPVKWHRERFDVVLRLDRLTPETPWRFQQCFPCLLSGDIATPM